MRIAGGVGVDRRVPPVEVEARIVASPDRGRRRRAPWPLRDETSAAIAGHPAFAGCSARQIRSIARLGDVVEIAEGSVLVHEDRIGYWFLAILDGTVGLTRRALPEGTRGPGDHLGDVAIIGFGPNRTTVIALSTVRAFVLGRRHLLALSENPAIQHALAGRTGNAYREYVRRLRADGDNAWRALPRGRPAHPITKESLPTSFRLYAPRPRSASGLIAAALTRPGVTVHAAPSTRFSPRLLALIGMTVLAVVVAVALTVRPPVVVVSPASAVDVTRDIEITGAPSHPVRGRYLLVAVHIERPTVAQWAWAIVRRRRIEPLAGDRAGDGEARRLLREEFVASRAEAARQAVRDAGLDPRTVTVEVRNHELIGPSAGLLYALAIEDALDVDDVSRGRTIAATGVIDETGRVTSVGWITMKAAAARAAAADIFLVPDGQDDAATTPRLRAVPVSTVAEARAVLLARE